MSSHEHAMNPGAPHPVGVDVTPALHERDRLTTAFRIILAIPHLILVGGPIAITMSWFWGSGDSTWDWGASGGVLGLVVAVVAVIGWFAILLTGRYPTGLRNLAVLYLSWRVRAVSYMALLRDEYPPFGDGDYPIGLTLAPEPKQRDRLTVAFRLLLAIPHIIIVWCLGLAWAVSTMIAWFAILLTGSYPQPLYDFGVGVLRWNTRVEGYMLLLHDDYPPFSLD
jgi:hypothetical protein